MVRRRVSITDVARAAGVSITTVSHSLNGKGRVKEDTRQHVREVAARLGYRAHPVAAQLAGRRTGSLAFAISTTGDELIPPTDYEYFRDLMDAAAEAALLRGYRLTLMPSTAPPDEWAHMAIDGAVLVDPVANDPIVHALDEQGVRVVTTGRDPARPDRYWVDNDHAKATRMVLDHLAAQGAKRIALVNSTYPHSYAIDTGTAYEQWCAARGLEPLVAHVSAALDESAGYSAALELLRADPRPDAIHAVLDRLALGVMLAARGEGVAVPDELLVSATTDSLASRMARPALTVVSLQPDEIGKLAVELLIELTEDREPADPRLLVPAFLMARSSTQAMARESAR